MWKNSSNWVTGFLLAVLCVILYAPVRNFGFLNLDDRMLVSENPYLRKGLTLEGFRWAWGADFLFPAAHADYWQPVTFIARMVLIQIFGTNPAAHHLGNVVLHAINAILIFILFRKMTGCVTRSIMVAALFAVHPLRVESVAWVVEIKDLLCGFFFLMTLWFYLRFVARSGWRRYLPMTISFALGLMSKPMIVTLPVVMLLLDVWPLRRVRWSWVDRALWLRRIAEKIPLFGMSLIAGWIALKAQPLQSYTSVPVQWRLVMSYGTYLWESFVPVSLHPVYPPWERPLNTLLFAGGWMALLGMTFLAFLWRTKRSWFATGWGWFIIALLPVAGLGETATADRFTYLPSIGLNLMLVWGLSGWASSRPALRAALPIVSTAVLISFFVLSSRQVKHWKDDNTLFSYVLRQREDNAVAHLSLGIALKESGNKVGAIRHFKRAIEIQDRRGLKDSTAQLSMIYLNEMLGRPDPLYLLARRNQAYAWAAEGKYEEAIREMESVMKLQPDDSVGHYNLAMMLLHEHRKIEAKAHLEAALRINPEFQQAREVFRRLFPDNLR